MTGKEFLNSVANARSDILQKLIEVLAETDSSYCVIGGLAVNAYVEPVVSLDIDIVVAVDDIESVVNVAERHGLRVERFRHSINISGAGSDLRIQVQSDPRYQDFLPGAEVREILGYRMRVAAIEDVLRGKVWAYSDKTRRGSKRQKDLADILRILEVFPVLEDLLPEDLKEWSRQGDTDPSS